MAALAILGLLLGCVEAEDTGAPVDRDGDGSVALEDCDDNDPRRAPGAEEVCDRLDNDCDGIVDEADDDLTDGAAWFVDADGDGAGDGRSPVTLCTRTDGYVASAGDCDDTDPTVSTSSTWYADEDGDGFGDPAASTVACGAPPGHVADATDCDDAASDAFPGSTEVCGDGVDQDCDGGPGDCGPMGDTVLDGDAPTYAGEGWLGASLAPVSAASEVPLFAVGAPTTNADAGEIVLIAWEGDALAAAGALTAAPAGARAGGRLEAADLDGDGAPDLLVTGARGDGGWLFYGPFPGSRSFATAAATLLPDTLGSTASLVPAGDHDGDGVSDLLLTYTGSPLSLGYVVSGSALGELTVTDALATLAASRSVSGGVAVPLGDTDGDGLADLAVVDEAATDTLYAQGATWIFAGPLDGTVALAEADARVLGDQYGAGGGMTAFGPGDLDGDGYADLLLGAPSYDGTTSDTGAAWLLPGPFAGGTALASANWTLRGVAYLEGVGASFAVADLDDDGVSDVVVGGAGDSGGRGAATWVDGEASGVLTTADTRARWLGAASGDALGAALLGAGDLDGDGDDDVLLGAPGAGGGTVYAAWGGPGL